MKLSLIGLGEFLDTKWMKKEKKLIAPNIIKFTEHFNKISNFAKTLIICSKNEDRPKRISFLVQVVKELLKLLNFSSSVAIYASFKTAAFNKLKEASYFKLTEEEKKVLRYHLFFLFLFLFLFFIFIFILNFYYFFFILFLFYFYFYF